MNFNPFGSTPLGFEQISDLSAAVGFSSVPAGAVPQTASVLLIAETHDVRWRDDGEDPTSSVGMLLVAGQPFQYQGDLSAIRFIETAPSAALGASFYGATGGMIKP